MPQPFKSIQELNDGASVQKVILVDIDGNPYASGGGNLSNKTITQTLNAGDNTVTHTLGVNPIAYSVKDGGTYVATTGNDININNFNVNLAGGSITDATIIFIYQV